MSTLASFTLPERLGIAIALMIGTVILWRWAQDWARRYRRDRDAAEEWRRQYACGLTSRRLAEWQPETPASQDRTERL